MGNIAVFKMYIAVYVALFTIEHQVTATNTIGMRIFTRIRKENSYKNEM